MLKILLSSQISIFDLLKHEKFLQCLPLQRCNVLLKSGLGEILNWIHLSVRQVDCKNHLSECTTLLSSVAYQYSKSISIIELFVSIYIDIYIEFLASKF